MKGKSIRSAINTLSESFVSIWTLMSDTTIFLSNHTKIFQQYEGNLRAMRHRLELNKMNPDVHYEIRQELVAIRKSLRQQGYNLRLGSLDLRLEGFRNDDALSEGFSRCAIAIFDDNTTLYVTGTANHLELDSELEQLIFTRNKQIREKHYLWFRWINRVLILSGAASEPKENFDKFHEYVNENKMTLIGQLAKMI